MIVIKHIYVIYFRVQMEKSQKDSNNESYTEKSKQETGVDKRDDDARYVSEDEDTSRQDEQQDGDNDTHTTDDIKYINDKKIATSNEEIMDDDVKDEREIKQEGNDEIIIDDHEDERQDDRKEIGERNGESDGIEKEGDNSRQEGINEDQGVDGDRTEEYVRTESMLSLTVK